MPEPAADPAAGPPADRREGVTLQTVRRTITDTDIVTFAGLSGDFNPLHIDDVFAAEQSPFGKRIAHGQLIASIVTGLASPLDDWPVLSYLGAQRRFRGPVFAGDTIAASYRVSAARASRSHPGAHVVTLDLEVANQRGEVVMDGSDAMLVADAGAPPGADEASTAAPTDGSGR